MPSADPNPTLHVVASFSEADGGPARYISELCGELAMRGRAVTLLTAQPATGPLMAVNEKVRLRALPPGDLVGFSAAVAGWTRDHPRGIVHLHGLWRTIMHHSAVAARKSRRPVVWAPMGMLEPWALQHRGLKKKLAWWMYQRRDLAAAAVVHATSNLEADSVRRTGLTTPVAVIPLGVALPSAPVANRVASWRRTALFLSRIHPKKGLLMLLEAWAAVRPVGWQLVIAGNDEQGHAGEVSAAIARLHLRSVVTMAGPVYGEAKEKLFREAHLFVLPSHSENFAVVVAEALVRGLPVLTTQGTPWRELVDWKAGWWVEPAVGSIGKALAEATSCSTDQLRVMGRAGAHRASREFSWESIATRMEELYEWIATGPGRPGSRPAFVEIAADQRRQVATR